MPFEKLSFVETLNTDDKLEAFGATDSWCFHVYNKQASRRFYSVLLEY
jgi:hypothetical protein